MDLTDLSICVSSVDPSAFHSEVQAGAKMVEIGNYESFYERGIEFVSQQIVKLARKTREMLPHITLSVTHLICQTRNPSQLIGSTKKGNGPTAVKLNKESYESSRTRSDDGARDLAS